ncbi:MAG TPA: hypothetical protein VMD30_08880, partial [Tepidisphaeraceae bacterium]|nr:hypothetical protein [Tepidisphaeraceae bacterium]
VCYETQRLQWRGMSIGNIPGDWKINGQRPKSGVLVCDIDAGSPMKSYGIVPGTLIDSVGGRPVDSVADMLQVVSDLPPQHCEVVFTPTILKH